MTSTVDYGTITPAMIEAVEDARNKAEAATKAWIESAMDLDMYRRLIAAHQDAEKAWFPLWLAAPIGSLLRAAAQDAVRGHRAEAALTQERLSWLLEAMS